MSRVEMQTSSFHNISYGPRARRGHASVPCPRRRVDKPFSSLALPSLAFPSQPRAEPHIREPSSAPESRHVLRRLDRKRPGKTLPPSRDVCPRQPVPRLLAKAFGQDPETLLAHCVRCVSVPVSPSQPTIPQHPQPGSPIRPLARRSGRPRVRGVTCPCLRMNRQRRARPSLESLSRHRKSRWQLLRARAAEGAELASRQGSLPHPENSKRAMLGTTPP